MGILGCDGLLNFRRKSFLKNFEIKSIRNICFEAIASNNRLKFSFNQINFG